MTSVTLYRAADGRLSGFECRGHAGYAQAGSDIVCAAVSVLSTTCVNALESVAGVKPQLIVRDGLMKAVVGERPKRGEWFIRVVGWHRCARQPGGGCMPRLTPWRSGGIR